MNRPLTAAAALAVVAALHAHQRRRQRAAAQQRHPAGQARSVAHCHDCGWPVTCETFDGLADAVWLHRVYDCETQVAA